MLKPITDLLERLAQRSLALGASLLACTLQRLHLQYEAEERHRWEELATSYEALGQPEVARALRERAQALFLDNAAELWLRELDQTPLLDGQELRVGEKQPIAILRPRSRATKSHRPASDGSASDPTPCQPPGPDVFFPLEGGFPHDKEQTP